MLVCNNNVLCRFLRPDATCAYEDTVELDECYCGGVQFTEEVHWAAGCVPCGRLVCLSICLPSLCLLVCLSVYLSVCGVCLSVACLSVPLSVRLSVCLSGNLVRLRESSCAPSARTSAHPSSVAPGLLTRQDSAVRIASDNVRSVSDADVIEVICASQSLDFQFKVQLAEVVWMARRRVRVKPKKVSTISILSATGDGFVGF